jgi:glycosyltransferase involved in cell wall biosynthesis
MSGLATAIDSQAPNPTPSPERLRIALTVDPEIPVPPEHYGGIERVVDMLARGLVNRGHEVHLFANPLSTAPARLVGYKGLSSGSPYDSVRNSVQLWRHIKSLGTVDVIHSFARLAYMLPLLHSRIPKVQSYQRAISPRSVRLGLLLARGSLRFTACSADCARGGSDAGGVWDVIPNGVPQERYSFVAANSQDAPLVFLGRVERIKGAHSAIQVARLTGRRLLVAGNRPTGGAEALYFEREIAPHCDGKQIEYVGPVNDAEKNELLGQAAALLFPIEWSEPFGIVMAEALACGTPIIAFRRGSVPEVVHDRKNGFICDSVQAMADAVKRIHSINRRDCRDSFEERYSDRAVVSQYERLYLQCAS